LQFLTSRLEARELMDDLSISGPDLTDALDELRWVNRFLGGYAAAFRVLLPFLRSRRGRKVTILDLGTGLADLPELIVRRAARERLDVEIVAIDANEAAVTHAGAVLDRRLPGPLRERIELRQMDAERMPFDSGSFDVVIASLFLHHFDDEKAAILLRTMNRLARSGILVNDLHRHPLAYAGIRAVTILLPVSPVFRNDGPVSVRRAFTRADLADLADRAGLEHYIIRWHWAFRWTLSTLEAVGRR
jgi:SAM-dependent methyltransferase